MIVVMKMFKYLLLELLPCFAFAAAMSVVLAQAEQSEFISIDCGLSESSNYTDPKTGIFYTSDAGFIASGVNMAIPSSSEESRKPPFLSVRSFPEGIRNCYTLRPAKGKDYWYLIRASFMYGNYDSKNQLPEFDLYIGEDLWITVSFEEAFSARQWEIIHTPSTDYVHACLHKTGATIPFISALELRPLDTDLYETQSQSLNLFKRWDLGAETDEWLRYPNDVYDRLWQPIRAVAGSNDLLPKTMSLSTDLTVVPNDYNIPPAVMRTAVTPQNSSGSLYMSWEPHNSSDQLYLCFHFAEVKKLRSNETRQFEIFLNGHQWNEVFPTNYLESYTIYGTNHERAQTKYELYINSTENSTLPPIINALEIYEVKKFKNSGTDDNDAAAIFGIKSYYGLMRNWQGDPCVPRAFTWEGLSCSYDRNTSSRIVSLNLSSSGLNRSIAPDIAKLISVQTLDLSNNNLEGSVPDFLAQLVNLTVLNIAGNNFNGTIPAKLQEKSKQGLLSFSIDGLPYNASKKKKKVILPIVASALAAFLLVFFVFITVCTIRRRKRTAIKKVDANVNKNNEALETKARLITYSEVLKITNNFERILGKGGFGKVYHGFMGDTQVAVKMMNPSSTQGHKEFQAEANLLMSVHHKNLTSLAGYCNEGTNIGIIYEYMANGNLKQHLSELNWEQRLGIALDVAQGLEYLHHGCKTPIIHRDVKPTNILLNEKFQAKLSDFGLSKAFASESGTHISVNTMAGSPGYMDPKCYSSYKLTEKSDVYSFGVVLLEIITGRPVLDMNRENRHISDWVVPFLESGDVRTIVDERFKRNFNINSAWKVVELAMGCVSRHSTKRPTMYDVVYELKQCLEIESNLETEPNSLEWLVVESECGPLVR